MGYSYEDAMSEFFGSPKKAHYTNEQIELAKKRQKKCGGTFMDNLEAVGRGDIDGSKNDSASKPIGYPETSRTEVSKSQENTRSVASPSDISSIIKDLNTSLEEDFGVKSESVDSLTGNAALGAFAGVQDILKEEIVGQDDFIKKLLIAFKRPFVSDRDDKDAKNSIYITGPDCTGKHFILEVMIKELHKRNILKSDSYYSMDLSLYPSAAEESLFLQDLYSALQDKNAVIVFENFESCHVANLGKLAELVAKGECRLQERYVMKNGALVGVSNTLAGDTVGTLEASGKYFIFISEKPVDKLAGIMGAPFVNALGDICVTDVLSDEAIATVAQRQQDELIKKSKKQLGFVLSVNDSFTQFALSETSRGRGLRGVLDTYSKTLDALAELRLERDEIKSLDIELLTENDLPFIAIDGEQVELASVLPEGYNGELEHIKEELDEIVGLKEVKDYILGLEEYYGVQKLRREAGLKAGELNKHMIFTGNPGTGKTTIARIVSKYLKAIGVLSGGQLVEVSRADLVGRYSGHTAPLTNQVIKSAVGGVLFIDEAYSLHRGKDDAFGLEAIDTLVKGIEDNRDNLVVILAGYSREMEDFLETNSGLKSRFPNIIDFPDYTADELIEITKITSKSKGYKLDDDVFESLRKYFEKVQSTNPREAGNGRLVRNKVEEAILNQSRRLVAEPGTDLSLLKLADFELE